MTRVGLLHPGAMGATVGGACSAEVLWCSDGRSPQTVARAAQRGLIDVGALPELVERSDVIVSVCPPSSAGDVAAAVAQFGFDGVYVDANAIAPATAREIAGRFDRFVDGGIVGPPAERPGTTRLYLSGADARAVADLWAGSALDARVIDGGPGAASALKMAFATWTKVSSALLLDVRALARAEGVEDALLAEWAISMPDTIERSERTAAGVGPKAWRFVGEMEQMVRAFGDAGLPDGFARGAAELYERLAAFKDADDVTLDAVLAELLDEPSA
jgi:3-hydroxyisobutyrate dehydrogenase-like beta-hydroxyacid dehydrogenase